MIMGAIWHLLLPRESRAHHRQHRQYPHPRMPIPAPSPLRSRAPKLSRLRQTYSVTCRTTATSTLVHKPRRRTGEPDLVFLRRSRACYCTHITRDNCRDYGVHNKKAHGSCAMQAGQHCYTAGGIATPTTTTDTKKLLTQGQVQAACHSHVQHRAICMTFLIRIIHHVACFTYIIYISVDEIYIPLYMYIYRCNYLHIVR